MNRRALGRMCILIPLLTAVLAFGSAEKVLYSFKGGSDGGEPGGMVLDRSGNLYGAAETGGRGGNINCFGNGCGFVYKLAPIAGGGWKKTNLYSFTGKDDGGVPVGNLAIDTGGNLYGVTEQGGTGGCSTVLGAGCGVVFRLSPNSKGKWDYKVIWNFGTNSDGDDGNYPNAGVVFDKAGNLYGTTTFGGSFVCDCGIVYQLMPQSGEAWTENILYLFEGISQGGTDVSFPDSDVFVDAEGNIFGTGTAGGDVNCNDGCGGVFELIPQSGGSYKEKVLHIFTGGRDGFQPEGGVLADSAGNLYGTTLYGGGSTGCSNGSFGCGTVFELRKSAKGYRENIIFRFNGQDGYEPDADLTLDSKNRLYGTTYNGGADNSGIVFMFSTKAGKWKESILYSFSGGQDGYGPDAVLTNDGKGGFFSNTAFGGAAGQGTVFQLLP
jgi:uncharacterized repeat protein (TIGR03803 family)